MPTMPLTAWAVLSVCALLCGFSKTAIGGVGPLAVALAAMVLPARDSTGMVLCLLLAGDVIAIWIYRQNVDWRLIGRLVLPVLAGIAVGAFFLAKADDTVLRRSIGAILLALVLVHLRAKATRAATGYGVLAGFTTMVANSGGPPMSLYLLGAGYDKARFMGTTSWFFFAVNLTKLPIAISLGVVRTETADLALGVLPALLVGAWIGRHLLRRIDQRLFERLVLAAVAVAAGYLLLG